MSRPPTNDKPHSPDSLAGGVFVGRQGEVGELKSALEDALSGRGRMVMLVGEPGIGKTRTAQELAAYAATQGTRVLWGRCHEQAGTPPYWPWVQAVRAYVREHEPDRLRSEMGAGAADIAEIVPEVKERLPELQPPPSPGSPEEARFRLFDSIATFLKNTSRARPSVIVSDNLHWADKPSLLLLEFLGQELGDASLLVVGTYRDADLSRRNPLAEALGELTRQQLFHWITLRGLSRDNVAGFIRATSGNEPDGRLVETIYSRTEGNPLFVSEVVRMLEQEGELVSQPPDRDIGVPEGVREAIGRRLNRLSEQCGQVLTVASVVGREFGLDQLSRLVDDLPEDRLLEVLEEGAAARVIEELPAAMGRYQFTHALM